MIFFVDAYPENEVIVFTEFLGDNSFAGSHEPNDVKKLILIDIQYDKIFMFANSSGFQ